MTTADVNVNAVLSDIRQAMINRKANSCPMGIRLAWHASGTFDKKDSSGGSDGATMRFEPESSDDANAGLNIMRDILEPVKKKNPGLTYADLWTMAGAAAVELLGGPTVPFKLGRTDAPDGRGCPANGRLPDAAQGAAHLRDVFYRMGFGDQEIVALSGAHTLGRCHLQRSGYDGPWTRNPLKFDNQYFRNLVGLKWTKKVWDGPEQYEDPTGELMMLPTDMALIWDPKFRVFAEKYAKDEKAFFADFAKAFATLISAGAPAEAQPNARVRRSVPEREELSAQFRELSMHGSVGPAKQIAPKCDVHAVEPGSLRSALHKAAFWGHEELTRFLVHDLKLNVNAQDYNGDTALHDAARFGHAKVVQTLLDGNTDVDIRNKEGVDALGLALEYGKPEVAQLLKQRFTRSRL